MAGDGSGGVLTNAFLFDTDVTDTWLDKAASGGDAAVVGAMEPNSAKSTGGYVSYTAG